MKGFIFDLDGVLIHTDKLHYQAWKKLADSIDVYFDEKINEQLRGVSRTDSLEIILKNSKQTFSSVEKEVLANEKNETYRELLKTLTPEDVAPEVRKALEQIKLLGYKLAVGSSSKNAKYIMDYTDLTKYFDAISDGNNITKSKPDPEVFIKAAEYLSLACEECYVVEDAFAGISAAKAGNFKAIGIGSATEDPDCDFKIHNLLDLISIAERNL